MIVPGDIGRCILHN